MSGESRTASRPREGERHDPLPKASQMPGAHESDTSGGSQLPDGSLARLKALDTLGSELRQWLVSHALQTGVVPSNCMVGVITEVTEVCDRDSGEALGVRWEVSDTTGVVRAIWLHLQAARFPHLTNEDAADAARRANEWRLSRGSVGDLVALYSYPSRGRRSSQPDDRVQDGRVVMFEPVVLDPIAAMGEPEPKRPEDSVEERVSWDVFEFVKQCGPCSIQAILDGVQGKAAMVREAALEYVASGAFRQEDGPRGAKLMSLVERHAVVIP